MSFGIGASFSGVSARSLPPGAPTGASNGLSVDVLTTDAVLGQDPGDPLNPAALTASREIPIGANFVDFVGVNFGGFPERFQIQSGALSIYGDPAQTGFTAQIVIIDVVSVRQLSMRIVVNNDGINRSPVITDNTVYMKFYPQTGTGQVLFTNNVFADAPFDFLQYFTVEGNGTFNGYVKGWLPVNNPNADEIALVNDSRTLYTGNNNVTAKTVFLPPAANLGVSYSFYSQGTQPIIVTPNPGDRIIRGTTVLAPSVSISSNVVGSCIELFVSDPGTWSTKSIHGTWI